ncbi:hypothetical protein ACV939_004181, partial [Escherichia coli]
ACVDINICSTTTITGIPRAYKSFRLNVVKGSINTTANGYIEVYGDLNIYIAAQYQALQNH